MFFNLLFFGGLVVLFGALTSDRRRLWLGTWFFFAAKLDRPGLLLAAGLCLLPLPGRDRGLRLVVPPLAAPRSRRDRAGRSLDTRGGVAGPDVSQRRPCGRWHSDASSRERVVLAVAVLALIAVIASSHQLTPFMLVLALAGLVLLQRVELRTLPVFAA